jgi:hypothetical protein
MKASVPSTIKKSFISFSGGVESSAMAVLFGGKANAIFADTGFEHDVIYDRIEKVEKSVRDFHGNDFTIIKIANENYTLPQYIAKSKFYPSFKQRFCTRLFKIEPIDQYLSQFTDGVELMIGLNSEEQGLRTGNHGNLSFVNYSYPLIENNINRKKCEEILNSLGLHPNFPSYMKRGGCKGCYYKSRKEYEAMIHLSPDEYNEVMELEESIQDERGKFYHIKEDMPSFRIFKEKVKNQTLLFEPMDMYPVINTSTNCGVFCNR